jgi:hypothetical protein
MVRAIQRLAPLLVAVCCLPAQARGQHQLDLTRPNARENISGGRGSGCATSMEGETPPRLNIALRIIEVAGGQIRLGEEFIYTIELENSGPESVVLPWKPSNGFDNRAIKASVRLGLQAGSLDEAFGYISLAGSTSIPGSTIVLRPGESARISARASGPMKAFAPSGASLSITATLAMMFAPCRWAANVTSQPSSVTFR